MGTVIHTSRFKAVPVPAKEITALDSFRRVVAKLENRVPFVVQAHELSIAAGLFNRNGWELHIKEIYYTPDGNLGYADLLVTHEQLQALMGC